VHTFLKEVLKNLFSKPVTIQYPREETQVEPDFRGRHYADLTKCIGCSLCAIECPSKVITMKPIPKELAAAVPKANRRLVFPSIRYFGCIFCYRCVTICPVNAYVVTNEYRLASDKPLFSDELSLETLRKAPGGRDEH